MPCAPPPTSPGALLRQRKPGQMGTRLVIHVTWLGHRADITTETRVPSVSPSDFFFPGELSTSRICKSAPRIPSESVQSERLDADVQLKPCATLHRPSCHFVPTSPSKKMNWLQTYIVNQCQTYCQSIANSQIYPLTFFFAVLIFFTSFLSFVSVTSASGAGVGTTSFLALAALGSLTSGFSAASSGFTCRTPLGRALMKTSKFSSYQRWMAQLDNGLQGWNIMKYSMIWAETNTWCHILHNTIDYWRILQEYQ